MVTRGVRVVGSLVAVVLGLLARVSAVGLDPNFEDVTWREPYRPHYHFTPPFGWMNDPNGMTYVDGKFHLFYQYDPDHLTHGPMSWGHATSKDLWHWEHLPVALEPNSKGDIWSGSGFVDHNDTAGFGEGTVMLMYTQPNPHHGQEQGIAFSTDEGQSFTQYKDNPVIANQGNTDFRDPKVLWHQPTSSWVVVLAVGDHVEFWRSIDLRSWTFASKFSSNVPGVWECPDLFPVPVLGDDDDGDGDDDDDGAGDGAIATKWVLLLSVNGGARVGSSGTVYFVGSFDGYSFSSTATHPESDLPYWDWIDYGVDNYAGVTFSERLSSRGEKIFVGWMSSWSYGGDLPTYPFRSAMTVPRALSLRTVTPTNTAPSPYILVSRVYDDLCGGSLTSRLGSWPQTIVSQTNSTTSFPGLFEATASETSLEIVMTIDVESTVSQVDRPASRVGVVLRGGYGNGHGVEGTVVGYDLSSKSLFVDRSSSGDMSFSPAFAACSVGAHTAPLEPSHEGTVELRVLLDEHSVEVFGNGGERVITDVIFPSESATNGLSVFVVGGHVGGSQVLVRSLSVSRVASTLPTQTTVTANQATQTTVTANQAQRQPAPAVTEFRSNIGDLCSTSSEPYVALISTSGYELFHNHDGFALSSTVADVSSGGNFSLSASVTLNFPGAAALVFGAVPSSGPAQVVSFDTMALCVVTIDSSEHTVKLWQRDEVGEHRVLESSVVEIDDRRMYKLAVVVSDTFPHYGMESDGDGHDDGVVAVDVTLDGKVVLLAAAIKGCSRGHVGVNVFNTGVVFQDLLFASSEEPKH